MDTLLERFLRYVTFHTRSDETNPACPSSEGQLIFARALQEEMEALGLTQVTLDEHCYLTGELSDAMAVPPPPPVPPRLRWNGSALAPVAPQENLGA